MKSIFVGIGAGLLLVSCSGAVDDKVAEKTTTTVEKVATKVATKVADKVEDVVADLSGAPAGEYSLDKGHGYITFSYLHQGYSKPYLRFNDWDSTLNWNPENPESSSVSVTIQTSSVDSMVVKFDDHLKSADMFDVEVFPTATFSSTSINRTGGNAGTITGDLTMKDVTKPITLDVVFNKAGETRGGGHKVGFSGKTQLKRSEWNLGYAVPYVGDDVDLVIEVEYEKSE